jgi:hypothetical protein
MKYLRAFASVTGALFSWMVGDITEAECRSRVNAARASIGR